MSWKFGGIYIRKDFSRDWDLLRQKLEMKEVRTEDRISWSKSIGYAFEGTAIGVFNGCSMVHNHSLAYDASYDAGEVYELDEICQRISEEGDVLCFFVDGMTSTGAFSWYHAGHRVRIYNNLSGKLATNFGPLLPGEKGQATENEDPEERIMDLIGFMVGVGFQELLRINPEMIVYK
jgi:hypothetical protein